VTLIGESETKGPSGKPLHVVKFRPQSIVAAFVIIKPLRYYDAIQIGIVILIIMIINVVMHCLQGPHQTPGQPFKFTVTESCDRIKEEFSFIQAQYHRSPRVMASIPADLLKSFIHHSVVRLLE